MTAAMPDWAVDLVDFHVHSSPSVLPRHSDDGDTVGALRALGFSHVVLKAHEGSTAERAALAGEGVYGGVVLNSPVGGANPDAVHVAARLGGRVVWMPTVSSRNHQAHQSSGELDVHTGFRLRPVDVVTDGELRPEWRDVLDAVAAHDLVLVSGHLAASETLVVFAEAHRRGVRRLLVNHPMMPFMGWDDDIAAGLRALDAHLELGILPDLLAPEGPGSLALTATYPRELLVFGGDLGHASFATPAEALPAWLGRLEAAVGASAASAIMGAQGRRLLL
ncbi:DUF6282 family protein [Microbacterium sp. X-17]|uniref:DUF6282 family protein n=1 Tax=Microbacterium sp. X-17 TaxID=3144404 RepID=UPI0031F5B3D5